MKTIKTIVQVSTLTLSLMALALPTYAEAQKVEQVTQSVEKQSPVDINRASVAELSSLDLVGEKRAQEIVRYREQHGPFADVESLTQVKGIGESTLERNRGRLLVSQ